MNEVFAEHIVKCRLTAKELIKRMAAISVLCISLLGILFLGMLGFTLVALMIYAVWYVFTITSIEYEYSVINTDLVIDKIMGQRKRKRVAEYDFKKAEIMAYVGSEHLIQHEQRARVKDFSTYTNNKKCVGVIFFDGTETIELVFEPNEKIVEAIRRIRPGIVKLD